MTHERSNIKAGLFVLGGLVLIGAVVLSMSNFDDWFIERRDVVIRFSIADGLKGLKVGSPVTSGGQRFGAVIDITDETDPSGQVIGKLVKFQIPENFPIYENARIEQVVPLIGGGTSLNVQSFGKNFNRMTGFHGPSWKYEPGDPPIEGVLATNDQITSITREMGIGELQRQQIRSIIANIELFSRAFGEESLSIRQILTATSKITTSLSEDLPKITANANATMEDIRSMSATLRPKAPEWAAQIDQLAVGLKSAIQGASDLMGQANETVAENRPALKDAIAQAKQALEHANSVAKSVRETTLGKIDASLDNAKQVTENLKKSTADLDTFLKAETPVLETTMANLRLVSDQLKLASIEIRRAPWRLMYSPTDKEIETDNLYDAARSFSMAASSLDSTAKSLQAIADKKLAPDDPNVKLMMQNLHQTFEKFKSAEDKFWKALDGKPAKK